MVRWSLIEEWLQLLDSRTRTHILARVLFQATLFPRLVWLIARICRRDNCRRSLSSDSGSVCGVRVSEAIALDYAAQCRAVKFMVKGTPERMDWIVASTSIKETNELLGNAASLAAYLSVELSGKKLPQSLILSDLLPVAPSHVIWYTVEYQFVLVLREYMLHCCTS